jgi:tight adherence protein B
MLYLGVLVALVATIGLAVAGLGQLATDAAERAEIRRRNVLEAAERRDRKLLNQADAAFQRTSFGRLLANHLHGAGVSWRPLTFAAATVGVVLLSYRVIDGVLPTWLAVPGAVLAGYGVWRYVERARNKRRTQFINQLPDVARLIANGSQAGLSLVRSIELAQHDIDEPAGGELRQVAAQIRLGQDLDRALMAMVERMPSRDVGVMVSTLVIQHRSGGDVVEALTDLAHTLEERREVQREIKVMLVGAVFTSYVIPVLVVGLLLLLNATSPGALDEMVSSAFGRIVLIVSGGLTALGYVLIRRITRVTL